MKPGAVRWALIAAWLAALAGCGDGAVDAGDDAAADSAPAEIDAAGAADTADAASDATPAADVVAVPDVLADTPDADDAADAPADTTADAVADAADAPDLQDAPDVPDAPDAAPDAAPDVAPDAAPDATVDALDPTCPYYPQSICLHWGVCKGANIKVYCIDGEPNCDYSQVAGYEPVEKSCDGLDNDCNNLVDDDLKLPPASKQAGICAGQLQSCGGKNGWQDPNFLALPLYETVETACDGVDNDCDGAIDIFSQPNKLKGLFGVCADAEYVCDGALGWEVPPWNTLPFWEPVETMCDGLDNDCDGLTDEGMDVANFLGSGVTVNSAGVCADALIRCLQGVWSPPDYTAQPGWESPEVSCDGLDNDCNGVTDDVPAALASKQAGVCAGQLLVCNGTIGWQDPDWSQLPGYATDSEWQCDGLDNDCDGLTDEDAACPLWQAGGHGSGQVALSADGQLLAWTTEQGAQVLDWQSKTVVRDWFGHDHAVTSLAFAPDGKQLATTGQLDVLQVWALALPADPSAVAVPVLKVGGLGTTFAAVAFSPDGGQLAVGDATGAVRIYALWSGLQVAALIAHKSEVTALAWLPGPQGQNGPLLSGDSGGVVWRWQPAAKTGQQMALMTGGVRAIAALPGSTQTLLVADGQAVVLDGADGTPLAQLVGGKAAWTGGALRPEGGGEAVVVEQTGAVRRYSLPPPSALVPDVTPVQSVAPPPEVAGDVAASLGARGGHVAVGFAAQGPWQLDLATATWTRAVVRHDGAVRDAAVTGGLLLSGGDDSAIRLWRLQDALPLTALWGHTGAVLAVQPLTQLPGAAPGSDLVTLLGAGLGLASGSDDFTVRLWTLTPTPGGAGVLTPKIFGLGGPWPQDLALTADVAGIWAAGGPTLSKFSTDPETLGKKLNAYPTKLGNVIERVVPSPDGKLLALGMTGDGAASLVHYRILNAKTFAVVREWSDLPVPTHALAWSPDSARVALSSPDGTITVADVATGALLQTLAGHTAAITALAWAPTSRLLSTSADGTARVWSGGAGLPSLPLATFSRHCPAPCSAQIAVLGGLWQDAAGLRVVTWASDGSLFAWKAPLGP